MSFSTITACYDYLTELTEPGTMSTLAVSTEWQHIDHWLKTNKQNPPKNCNSIS